MSKQLTKKRREYTNMLHGKIYNKMVISSKDTTFLMLKEIHSWLNKKTITTMERISKKKPDNILREYVNYKQNVSSFVAAALT